MYISWFFHKKGKCHFPFIYKTVQYYHCTVTHDKDCHRWCATLVDKNNVYVKNSNQWKYCDNKCPVNYDETCKKRGEHPWFREEWYKENENTNPRPKTVEVSGTCGTLNTTTMVKSRFTDSFEDHHLINPGRCVFPFNYKGTWYDHCIAIDDPVCRFWCSIRNDHGYHRKYGSQWAYCKEAGCNMTMMDMSGHRKGPFNEPPCYLQKHGGDPNNHWYEWEMPRHDYIESDDPNFKYDEDYE